VVSKRKSLHTLLGIPLQQPLHLANGVPIETVSSMLGHNSIRTTQIYAKVVEKKVSEDMQLLKAKLFGGNQKDSDKQKVG
jgi:integrase